MMTMAAANSDLRGLKEIRDLASAGALETAIAAGRALGPVVHGLAAAEIATEIGWLSFQAGAAEAGLDDTDRAIALWCARGDERGEARARAIRALLELELGRGERGAEQAVAALRGAEASGDTVALSWALNTVGIVFWFCRQYGRAAECCSRAVALGRAAGDDGLTGLWLVNLAAVQQLIAIEARESGDEIVARLGHERAATTSREACEKLERAGELAQRVTCLLNQALGEIDRGRPDEAASLLRIVDALPPVDSPRMRLFRNEVVIELKLANGEYAAALPLIERALAVAEREHQFEATLASTGHLATVHEQLGNFEQALACLKRRHALEQQVSAERVGQRARTAEIMLGLRRLEATVADMVREREAIARSYASLSREATVLAADTRRDALTGIANRRRLDEAIAALDPKQPVALAMIDIDRFKSINDQFSHIVGDNVLRRVARALEVAARPGDLLARFGGEEFTLLMPGADARIGRRICDQLRRALLALNWDELSDGVRITASLGVAGVEEVGHVGELLALADGRLYQAKRTGRDRVVGGDGISTSGAAWIHRIRA